MEISNNTIDDPLLEIVVDREGLEVMINAAQLAIQSINEYNLGDEYDTDITPYHEMYKSLKQLYAKFYE